MVSILHEPEAELRRPRVRERLLDKLPLLPVPDGAPNTGPDASAYTVSDAASHPETLTGTNPRPNTGPVYQPHLQTKREPVHLAVRVSIEFAHVRSNYLSIHVADTRLPSRTVQ